MATTNFDDRFFETTRGKIVLLLRTSNRTVNELSEALELSDNAIRAHLISLERDGLVTPGGTIKGFRKPHYVFQLTDEARHVFPKSYDSLFNQLIDVLKQRLATSTLKTVFHDVGVKVAGVRPEGSTTSIDDRVDEALGSLKELGGAAIAVKENGDILIKSESCMFADVVSEHPEVCKIAESMIEEIVGKPVTERCDRTATPKCRFAINIKEP